MDVPLDAPAFGVHRLYDRRPAAGQFVDATAQQLLLGGAEALAGEPGVQGDERAQPLEVEEEQHPAEDCLHQQFVPPERALDHPLDNSPARTTPKPSSPITRAHNRPV